VLTKDHKPLGWLKYLTAAPEGRIGVVVRRGNQLLKVWEMKNLEGLIHHSENFSSQIKTGVLVLNRDWEGNYVPDVDVHVPAIPREKVKKLQTNGGGKTEENKEEVPTVKKGIEERIGELNSRNAKLQEKVEHLSKVVSELREEKMEMKQARDLEKIGAEASTAALMNTLKRWDSWTGKLMKMLTTEKETKIRAAEQEAQRRQLLGALEDLRGRLRGAYSMDRGEASIDSVLELVKKIERLAGEKRGSSKKT